MKQQKRINFFSPITDEKMRLFFLLCSNKKNIRHLYTIFTKFKMTDILLKKKC